MNVAGAYWRGDETREQLTRIYGVTFPKQSELTDYLHMIEEAKKRDQRTELIHSSRLKLRRKGRSSSDVLASGWGNV